MRTPAILPKNTQRSGLLLLVGAATVAVILLCFSPRTRVLSLNTFWLSCGTCLIALPIGIFLSLLLTRTDVPGKRIALAALGSLLFIPLYLQCAGWQAAFGTQGWYTLVFSPLNTSPILAGWWGAIWVHAMAAIPWVVLIVAGSLYFVDPAIEESALIDSPSWKVIWHVTLPQSIGGSLAASLWVFVTTAGEITITDLFAVRTLAEDLYTGFYLGDTILEAELGFLPAISLFVILFLAAWILSKRLLGNSPSVSVHRRWIFHLGRWRIFATILLIGMLLFIIGIPIISLIYHAGVTVEQFEEGRVRTWTLMQFLQTIGFSFDVLRPVRRHAAEFCWTFGIAALASTTAVILAAGLSWIARGNSKSALAVMFVTAGLFAVPGPMVGQSIITLLNQRDIPFLIWLYDRSIFAPWLAMLVRCLPLCILMMWHALRTVSPATLDAAAADGATSMHRFLLVAVPQRLPALACAWIIGMAIAVADLGTVILVVPPGVDLLSVRIFGLLHAGVENEVAGICLINFAAVAIITWTAIIVAKRLDL